MEDYPRNPKAKILTNEVMLGIAFTGIVLGLVAYGAFLVSLFIYPHGVHPYENAITITFISIIFGQYANILSRRTYGNALGKYLFSNMKLLIAFVGSIFCILLIVYIPSLNLYFHTAPLQAVDWILPVASGVICLSIYEFKKKIYNHLKRSRKDVITIRS